MEKEMNTLDWLLFLIVWAVVTSTFIVIEIIVWMFKTISRVRNVNILRQSA